METKKFFYSLLLALYLSLCLSSSPLMAKDSYQWTDDRGETYTVYHDPYYVAVFNNKGKTPVKSFKLEVRGSQVDVYRSEKVIFKKDKKLRQTRNLNYEIPKGTLYSPVFSDSETGEPKKILAGNFLLYFPMNKSEKDIQIFLEERKLKSLKKLPFVTKNAYLIESNPGFETLDLCNKIKEENPKDILAAYPDWSQAYVIKDLKRAEKKK